MLAGGIGNGGWNLYSEHRSVAILAVGGADGPPMQLDKLPNYGEPQSQASISGVGLPKSFEYVGQEVLVDARAVVDDLYLNVGPVLTQADLDFAVFETEPYSIRKQIPNDLTKPVRISFDALRARWSRQDEADSLGIGLRSQGVNCRLNEGMKIDPSSP